MNTHNKDRNELKSLFKNGCIPTQNDFAALIDSVLVKRSDCFFGKWQEGTKYCLGDVVIYGKSLWMLTLEGGESPDSVQQYSKNSEEIDTPCHEDNQDISSDCFCSTCPPGFENNNWCQLELKVEDDDWAVVPSEVEGEASQIMYAKVFGRIGMGTEEPEARLDVKVAEKGQFLFDPDEGDSPRFEIKNLSEESPHFLKSEIGRQAAFTTDAPIGYAFKIEQTQATEEQTELSPAPTLILAVQATENGLPRVGIGPIENPEAALDIHQPEMGRVQVKTDKSAGPEVVLYTLQPERSNNYFGFSIGEEYAVLTTDAEQGFRFKKGSGYSEFVKNGEVDNGTTLVTFAGNGKVGVGTENPLTHLQVTDHTSGDFRMSLNKVNPAFSIINTRPKAGGNYLTMGADNDQALFITDSKDGFVFKSGVPCATDEGEEVDNMNDGEKLVRILPDGKVGIGTRPHDYHLKVDGLVQACTFYQTADNEFCQTYKPMNTDDIFNDLKKLKAYTFEWNDKSRCAGEETQIGFKGHEVEDFFPEIVKTSNGVKSVAYQNLIPVLVEAINQLQERVCDLEEQLGMKGGDS